MRLLGQKQSSRNVARVIAQQNAEIIFLLCDLPFEICDGGLRSIHQLLRLTDVKQRGQSVLLFGLRELQRILARQQRPFGND